MKSSSVSQRLFFALWPPDQIRQSIVEQVSPITDGRHGRVMPVHNLHMTLHFVGQVNAEKKACYQQAARSISAEKFQLKLDRFGCFSKARIFWMGMQTIPRKLEELYECLGAELEDCGFRRELRSYSPHITLLRKCTELETPVMEPVIVWDVQEFVLLESVSSEQGVDYQVIEKYPLS